MNGHKKAIEVMADIITIISGLIMIYQFLVG